MLATSSSSTAGQGADATVAWHVGQVIRGADHAPPPRRGKPLAPPKLPAGIDAGAEDAASLFRASLARPAALAKTVADRKDVVLLGSDADERYLGAAQVRATLLRWNLGCRPPTACSPIPTDARAGPCRTRGRYSRFSQA